MMDIIEIQQILIHRYPLLLVDRVLEMEPGQRVVAIKNVTVNEPFFQGHFPGNPIMPGVLVTEAMSQASGLLGFKTLELESGREEGKVYMYVGSDNLRFRSRVVPGDQLRIEATIKSRKRNVWKFDVEATVDGKVVANGIIICAGG